MLSKLPLFLLGTCLFIIPTSLELPDTRVDGEDSLDETLEQLLTKVSGLKREKGLVMDMDMSEDPLESIPDKISKKEDVGDGGIIREDVTDEKGEIIEQRYRDCDKRKELIVMKPGTKREECLIFDLHHQQYAYECENTGNRTEHVYQITEKIKDKTFLTEAFGSSLCQNVSLSRIDHLTPADVGDKKLQFLLGARGCIKYCCVAGSWGSCALICFTCN